MIMDGVVISFIVSFPSDLFSLLHEIKNIKSMIEKNFIFSKYYNQFSTVLKVVYHFYTSELNYSFDPQQHSPINLLIYDYQYNLV